ncbi:hypothetical protein Tco_0822422 [Tanacetum coccineum]|uniref:Reverse transcriptase Ty1/copia-type domain-containing protein n=1 Tax=Tanacetum coccineum TaxID=301880 RepID=A0ABQ5AFZ8_9ASTR
MDVKKYFLYGRLEEECMYVNYQDLKDPDLLIEYIRYQVNHKVSQLYAVKRIFRYLKGQPKLSLWYPKDSPFDLVAYTDSDYAGASMDRKSITGENGNAPPITKVVEGVDYKLLLNCGEKEQRRLELKARSTLLMGTPNEYQLKFNSIKDAKSLLQAL